jgi:hypothetical protein
MKLPPINVKIECEIMKRDAAARWLAKYNKKPATPKYKRKGARR